MFWFCVLSTAESRAKVLARIMNFKPLLQVTSAAVRSFASLFIVATIVCEGLCGWSLFCNAVFCVLSSFVIISPTKRKLVNSLKLCSCVRVTVSVLCLFLTLPWADLWSFWWIQNIFVRGS